MAVNSALQNLKALSNSPKKPRLRVADLAELEHLVVEFRSELKSVGANSRWFESFLDAQGVRIPEIEARVDALNQKMS